MAYDPPVNETGKHGPKRRHHGEGSTPFRATDARRQRPFRCKLRLGRDPITGKLREKWFSGTSAAEAAKARDAYRALLRKAGSPAAADATVGDALTAYLEERRGGVDASTWLRYEGLVRSHLIPTLGTVPLAALSAPKIRAVRDQWGTSASSRNLALGVLKAALRLAVEEGRLPSNPADSVRRLRKAESRARFLDVDDARRLLDALAGDPIERIVTVGLALGPRRGEVLGMRWADLDLTAGTWTLGLQLRHIPPAQRRAGEGPYRLIPPKAGHAQGRVISLPVFVVDALRAQRDDVDAMRRAARIWSENDLVFCDAIGQALPPNSITRRFVRLAERAGLGHLRMHDLRHSAATIMLALGVPERVVQDILGHASGEQTRGYMKVVRRLGEDAADRMQTAVGASR